MGGGIGVSHGCTVRGRFLTVIQLGQEGDWSSLSKPSGDEGLADFFESAHGRSGILNELLGRPTFLRATLVARLENMVPQRNVLAKCVRDSVDCVTMSRGRQRRYYGDLGKRETEKQCEWGLELAKYQPSVLLRVFLFVGSMLIRLASRRSPGDQELLQCQPHAGSSFRTVRSNAGTNLTQGAGWIGCHLERTFVLHLVQKMFGLLHY
jgi:hypothetical protein